ncbi:rod-binding protein [Novosphingobium sp.]|uniref:rod-binding protein n=1 Tax=Novosphingobium sp. TaxID=1874826 RepID=UPI003D0D2A68
MTTISPITAAGASAAAKPLDPRLKQAAQGFEAIFVRQMLASARKDNFGDTLWGSDQGHDTFTAMRDEKFADITAHSGTLGLAKQIEDQLAGKGSPAIPATGAKP